MKLVFATNNKHKFKEVQNILLDEIELVNLKDIGCTEEIPENQDTIEGNAFEKSSYVYENYGLNCFSDDTGLEIEGLDGRPGVYAARYAGVGCTFEDNVNKVLNEMEGVQNRSAKFRTIISLIIDGKELQFEGSVEGEILTKSKGVDGFGYDPIFQPIGYSKSFSEMNLLDKNKISHRAIAVNKFSEYLNSLVG